MRNKISNGKDFRSRVYDNPIELLREIKKHALNYQEYKYEMMIVADSLRTLLHTRQKDQENLQDYARRFKTAEEIFKSHIGGPLIIPSIVQSDPDFDEEGDVETNKQIMEDVYERFLAYLFLEQSDRDKYGTLLKTLNTQHSLQNNQYPKTVSQASNILSNHRYDPEYQEKLKKQKR